jgi:hypothetical protein
MSAYPAALREFHEFGDDLQAYCWAGGDPLKCRSDAAMADEKQCTQSAYREHGYTLSERRAMSHVAFCMHNLGWVRMAQHQLIY